MFEIVLKEELAPKIKLFKVLAPELARKAQPGQFIILRIDEEGERIPLTIADFDREAGTITIIFQEVGKTTELLGTLEKGDFLKDFVGPLGMESEIENYGTVVCIGATKSKAEYGFKSVSLLFRIVYHSQFMHVHHGGTEHFCM
jgi:ferredoxin--NADP+ reductase